MDKERIEELNNHQKDGRFHPLTCSGYGIKECKRNSSYKARQKGEDVPYTNENEGVLIATEKGWICPCGKYKQKY